MVPTFKNCRQLCHTPHCLNTKSADQCFKIRWYKYYAISIPSQKSLYEDMLSRLDWVWWSKCFFIYKLICQNSVLQIWYIFSSFESNPTNWCTKYFSLKWFHNDFIKFHNPFLESFASLDLYSITLLIFRKRFIDKLVRVTKFEYLFNLGTQGGAPRLQIEK